MSASHTHQHLSLQWKMGAWMRDRAEVRDDCGSMADSGRVVWRCPLSDLPKSVATAARLMLAGLPQVIAEQSVICPRQSRVLTIFVGSPASCRRLIFPKRALPAKCFS